VASAQHSMAFLDDLIMTSWIALPAGFHIIAVIWPDPCWRY
jgi:hypothetical protein